jgi:hypothetical protein
MVGLGTGEGGGQKAGREPLASACAGGQNIAGHLSPLAVRNLHTLAEATVAMPEAGVRAVMRWLDPATRTTR